MNKREIPFSPPDIKDEDINQVIEVLKSGWITTGPQTKLFENEIALFSGTNKAVGLSSCTAALEMTMRILGIGEGDEVIVPAYTYTATAASVHHTGATIKIVDCNKDNFEMDYSSLEQMINGKTKAIIPVDVGGKPCDYNKIHNIIENSKHLFEASSDLQSAFNRIVIIADAAHSFGAKYLGDMSGNIADFTCFSFHAVKNLTTAEGGAVTWKSQTFIDDEELYKKFMLISLHGQSKDALSKSKVGQWEYDIIAPLYKCNMTDIQASLGRSQLKRYSGILERRKEIIEFYNENINDKFTDKMTHFDENLKSAGHLYLINIKEANEELRNEIIQKMALKGVSCNVHYKPLPLLTAYKEMGFDINNFPNAYNKFKNEISLPLNTKLSDDDLVYIVKSLNEILGEVGEFNV
ncbi:DegT/DnrJ/EryC1/StrS aminotransferase family protein [Staphylococcus saprophyticus]|uniref:DegT/DnrJ/EryC1/StrS family aminotransferase n=1 Tax=Staphylococcus saprophyticus TaxID=29385 RepID=UPI0008534891|nr:DegT/DnrJ/EryC1/StrS aminotransferase family protein [Staphylococcus saprophyticus]MDW4440334.1 DegT/DnrJ/EryC1/StrS aminotransferase family protein [Staphylococcus saprophyticus]OEK46977.1 capsular biosynthesis protein [Staphylococcus saprophyticus]WFR69750.1 DegT/DnrJ/EryC1/StrS aminotransferase family protein [Staphylococcus saprophyticus]